MKEKDSFVKLEYRDNLKNITTDDQEDNQNNYIKEILQMLLYFAIIIGTVLVIHQYVGQQIEVSGSSMENTLHNKDHLILEKISYRFHEPKRYDIIVFRPYQDQKDLYYIKRIIGLPGESVQIIGSNIYINGKILNEQYGNDTIIDAGIAAEKIELAEDEYFLLGDNRNNSKDSRDSGVGVVKRSAIIGRSWIRIWPLKSFGILEHQ